VPEAVSQDAEAPDALEGSAPESVSDGAQHCIPSELPLTPPAPSMPPGASSARFTQMMTPGTPFPIRGTQSGSSKRSGGSGARASPLVARLRAVVDRQVVVKAQTQAGDAAGSISCVVSAVHGDAGLVLLRCAARGCWIAMQSAEAAACGVCTGASVVASPPWLAAETATDPLLIGASVELCTAPP
jgi:hypothetical protein